MTVRGTIINAVVAAIFASSVAGLNAADADKSITSKITTAKNGDVVLTQEVTINAPVKKVWEAYSTSKGWQAWVAPVAEVELKIGGVIKTNYRKGGTVNDADAITLHVINYVPERVLTLQAEVSKNWPEILKEREKQMFNVITFTPLGEGKTKLVSYGIGYRDTPALQRLLKFFVSANEQTFRKLIAYVEKGKPAFEKKSR